MKRNNVQGLVVSHEKQQQQQQQKKQKKKQKREKHPLRQQWDEHAFFFTETELTELCLDMHKKRAITGDDMLMASTNCTVTQSVMPYMVNNPESVSVGGDALSNDLMFDLYNKETYNKLNNFLEMVSCTPAKDCTVAGIMSPACMDSDLAVAILVACGPTLEVALKGDGRSHVDNLLALPTITPIEQAKAQAWIAAYWHEDGNKLMKWRAEMPSFVTLDWWKFVGRFMRDTLGFGIENKRVTGVSATTTTTNHRLVANGFWKKHRIDAVQVGQAHRLRTCNKQQSPATVPILHNGRPYGVLAKRERKCDRCPPSRPTTQCVRQNGAEWLCSLDRFNVDTLDMCHRRYNTPINTGYLDDDEREDAVTVDEKQPTDKEPEEKKEEEELVHSEYPQPQEYIVECSDDEQRDTSPSSTDCW
jgi:hypothetical protein